MDKKAITKIIIIAVLCTLVTVCGTGCQPEKKNANAITSTLTGTEMQADVFEPSTTPIKTEEPTTRARAEPIGESNSDRRPENTRSEWTEYIYVKKIFANRKYYDSIDDMHADGWYGYYEIRDVLDHTIDHPANSKH